MSSTIPRGFFLVFVLAVFAAINSPALAWDPMGHMIVNQIAWDRLTPKARADVKKSLAAFNKKNATDYDFVTAGCWMDDIRGKTREYNTWHYIDLPYNPTGTPFPVDWQVNGLWAMRHCVAILRGERTDPDIDKDQALVMLTHLVGDLHQPLHATNRNGDAGGNGVSVPNIQDANVEIFPKWRNLHYFWDTSYRRTVRDGDVVELYAEPVHLVDQPVARHQKSLPLVREQAAAFQKSPSSKEIVAGGDLKSWVEESHALGYTEGYQKLPGDAESTVVTLDDIYVDNAREISQKRVTQAGLRLAGLLNEISQ
jgi:hypothetical protein